MVSRRPRPCLGAKALGQPTGWWATVGQSHFSKSSCLGQRVRIPVPSCSTLLAIERRRICVVAAIVRWARRWQEHGWANPPGIVCFRPKPGLAQKKIHSRSISAAPARTHFPQEQKKQRALLDANPPPSPALLVPINVQCISPSEQRLVLECFYPTPDRTGPLYPRAACHQLTLT